MYLNDVMIDMERRQMSQDVYTFLEHTPAKDLVHILQSDAQKPHRERRFRHVA